MTAKNSQKLKKNLAGFWAGGLWHPIRNSEGYDPTLAGDQLEFFGKMARKEANLQKSEKNWREQVTRQLEREMYGDADNTETKGKSLAQFVRAEGGLRITKNDKGELKQFGLKNSGKRGLVSETKGKTLDYMYQSALESGYKLNDLYDLIDKLDDEIRGGKTLYATHGNQSYRDNPAVIKINPGKFAVAYNVTFPGGKRSRTTGVFQTQTDADKFALMLKSSKPRNYQVSNVQTIKANPAKLPRTNGSGLINFQTRTDAKKAYETAAQLANQMRKVFDVDGNGKLDKKDVKTLKKAASKANPEENFWTTQARRLTDLIGKMRKAKKPAAQIKPVEALKNKALKMAKNKVNPTPYKQNGFLEVFAQLAVGTAAALDVHSRVKNGQLSAATPKPAATKKVVKTILKPNRDESFHEREFEKLLVAIEKGDKSKIGSAKRQAKLAGYSDNEAGWIIDRARLSGMLATSRDKNGNLVNPSLATIKAAEIALLKQNGIVGRAWARRKATNAYRRQLKLEDRLKRVKLRRAAQEKKARAKDKKRNPDAYESFQGRPSTKTVVLDYPERAPKTGLYCLGKLFELKIKGIAEPVNFRRAKTKKDYWLCANEKTGQLWIAGGASSEPDNTIEKGYFSPIGEIHHVVYQTYKPHLGDKPGQGYIHEFGEEGGQRPTLGRDRHGFAIIDGGDYQITALGIKD